MSDFATFKFAGGIAQQIFFIIEANKPVTVYISRVKTNGYIYIAGYSIHGFCKFFYQYFFGFMNIVEVSKIAISFFCKRFQFAVFIIAHAYTQAGKCNA